MNDGLHDRDHNTHECILVYTNMVLAPYARHLACLYSSLSCGPDNEIPNTSCQVFGAHCAESWPGCSLRHRSADVMLQYRYRTALWFVWHQRGDSKDKHRDITPLPPNQFFFLRKHEQTKAKFNKKQGCLGHMPTKHQQIKNKLHN